MTRCRKRKQALDPKRQSFRALNMKHLFWRNLHKKIEFNPFHSAHQRKIKQIQCVNSKATKYLKRLKRDRSVQISYSKWRHFQQQQWSSSDVAFYAPYHTNIMRTDRKFTIFQSFVNKSVATAVKIFGGCIPPETHGQASPTLIEGNLEIDKIDIWKC